jgi:hypothetical protein
VIYKLFAGKMYVNAYYIVEKGNSGCVCVKVRLRGGEALFVFGHEEKPQKPQKPQRDGLVPGMWRDFANARTP